MKSSLLDYMPRSLWPIHCAVLASVMTNSLCFFFLSVLFFEIENGDVVTEQAYFAEL